MRSLPSARNRWWRARCASASRERTYFDGKVALPLSAAELKRVRRAAASQPRRVDSRLPAPLLRQPGKRAAPCTRARAAGPAALGLASHPCRVPRVRAALDHRGQRVRRAADGPRTSAGWSAICRAARLRVMQSNGSAIGARLARDEPVRTILSGPAAGVIGAAALVARNRRRSLHHFRHGRHFDRRVAVRRPRRYPHAQLSRRLRRAHSCDRHPHRGRRRRLDRARSTQAARSRSVPKAPAPIRVPPATDAATAPTVTDADLVAGRLMAENFLGGAMRLYPDARGARDRRARPCDAHRRDRRGQRRDPRRQRQHGARDAASSPSSAASTRAISRCWRSAARGPMHACELALDLGIRHVVLPRNPGLALRVGRAAVRRSAANTRSPCARPRPIIASLLRARAPDGRAGAA